MPIYARHSAPRLKDFQPVLLKGLYVELTRSIQRLTGYSRCVCVAVCRMLGEEAVDRYGGVTFNIADSVSTDTFPALYTQCVERWIREERKGLLKR
jgi:hypothetical protein